MPEKENNHYVPCLILRRFDENISIYNLRSRELKINQRISEVFSSRNLYTKEIEDMFNVKAENTFARILNKKILAAEESCSLSRKEVGVVKKFLTLAMLRTMDAEDFVKLKADKTRDTVKTNYKFVEKPEVSSLPSYEYWMQTLKCVLEADSPIDVQKNRNATAIAVYWSNVFNSGYIAIWDSESSKEDFIIMDQGMTSEHEKTRFIPSLNNDMIKRGYLIEKTFKVNKPTSEKEMNLWNKYFQIALANDGFSENVYLFTISKNRMIAFINPFFRLYDKDDWSDSDSPQIPDIWTTLFQDRGLFQKNANQYVDPSQSKKGIHNNNDVFMYKIHEMNVDDVIYVNCLVLDRIQTYVGFSESGRIRRSLITYSCVNNALNNYDGLLNNLSQLGYDIVRSSKYQELACRFYVSNNFTESERKYISNYLEIKALSDGKKQS